MKGCLAFGEIIRMMAHKMQNERNHLFALVILFSFCSSILAQDRVPQKLDGAIIPISKELCNEMKLHKVLNPGSPVGCDRLRMVNFSYVLI